MHLTTKQREILNRVLRGNTCPESGVRVGDLDLDQLMEVLSYQPSKQALQFSIRYLVKKGMLEKGEREKRRGRSRRVIRLTPMAETMLTPGTVGPEALGDVVIEGFDDFQMS